MTTTIPGLDTARAAYERDGFCIAPPLLDPALVTDAHAVMDRVIQGEYATGTEPMHVNWRPGSDPSQIVKIDQPQMADHAITDLFRRSRIGEFAAALTGADLIQVWAVQLLYKPPAGAAHTTVGWHQDDDYWNAWWEGEVFTCWLALTDVTEEAGPLRFVKGSHEWGFLASGNFFAGDLDGLREKFSVPADATWEEHAALLPAGAASFHHRRTIHGSGPNTSSGPRRSYAVHLRTERSKEIGSAPEIYHEHLSDDAMSPILFQR